MKEYVLGFAFSIENEYVLLIRKTKPDWQAGKLNGIGGKIEPIDQSPETAMVREFYEETNVKTIIEDWTKFAVMSGDDFKVHVYKTNADITGYMENKTEETVELVEIDVLSFQDIIPNIVWLIEMAFDRYLEDKVLEVKYPSEKKVLIPELQSEPSKFSICKKCNRAMLGLTCTSPGCIPHALQFPTVVD